MNLPENFILKQLEMGPLANYVYFVGDATTKEVAIIDLSGGIEKLIAIADNEGYKIKTLLLTHSHFDHTTGIDELLSKYDIPVYMSKEESQVHKTSIKNLVYNEDRQKIKIGDIEIECILTPGHTPGCQCFKYKDVLLTGDTLFIDGCGRCDLPGGSAKQMYNSLYNIIMKFPDDTIIFPGHAYGVHPYADLKDLKRNNHYLTCKDENEFLSERM